MTEIEKWLDQGAEVREGLRLLDIYAPNDHLRRMAERYPDKYGRIVRKVLAALLPEKVAAAAIRSLGSFRKEWPFLSDPDCPPELKILASDKITAYHNYVQAHEDLFTCTTEEQCYLTAKKLLENFTENVEISNEFSYYKASRSILGKHRIFKRMKDLEEIRKMNAVELMREKRNLEGGISRLKLRIRKEDRPDLEDGRRQLIREKQARLDEIERMLQQFTDERRN